MQDIGIPDVPFIEKNHLRPLFGENWMEVRSFLLTTSRIL